jgi:hypothetical protein
MTRRGLMLRISLAVVIYAVAIGVGCDLRFRFPKREDLHYVLYKDLVPLIVAIPAAWLAYCFQRRASYLQQLRAAWEEAVGAIRGAILYTHKARPSAEDRGAVLADLGAAIDQLRGLFRGAKASPFASMEAIRAEIEALGTVEEVTAARAEAARSAIQEFWEVASGRLLLEFDRVSLADRAVAPSTGRPSPKGRVARAVGGPTEARSQLTTHLAGR